jgi:CO/xanthine dehydrogenase FAD-binding subunit
MTLGATLEIAGPGGRRQLAIERFFTSDGVWNRRLAPDELLVSIILPPPPRGTRYAFEKLRSRASIDFPLLNLAVAVRLDEKGAVRGLEMVASGMGSYPRRIGRIEEVAEGNRLTASVVETVAQEAFRQCHPLATTPVDAEWRRAMVKVLVRRALQRVRETGG